MDKVLVVLEVPSIQRVYEVFIPLTVTVNELAALLAKSVEDLSGKYYAPSNNETLCLRESNVLLNGDARVSQYAIQNGDHLVMI